MRQHERQLFNMTLYREPIEWCNIWVPEADQPELPRVLFIGDSITQGYYPVAAAALEGRAATARLTTSRFLTDPFYFEELALLLRQYPWAVVHVNNGLHGWNYTEEEYAAGLPRLIAFLREQAPNAQLIWAQSTPKRVPGLPALAVDNPRVETRNVLAREAMTTLDVPVNDLYTLVVPHPALWSSDGVHFNDEGYRLLGGQAVEFVLQQFAL
jgi:lysophospholipase L1-like esterase